ADVVELREKLVRVRSAATLVSSGDMTSRPPPEKVETALDVSSSRPTAREAAASAPVTTDTLLRPRLERAAKRRGRALIPMAGAALIGGVVAIVARGARTTDPTTGKLAVTVPLVGSSASFDRHARKGLSVEANLPIARVRVQERLIALAE